MEDFFKENISFYQKLNETNLVCCKFKLLNNPIPGLSGPACMLAKGWSGGRGHPPDIGRGCSRPGKPKEIWNIDKTIIG